MKHYYRTIEDHKTAIFKRKDANFTFSQHLADIIIQGLTTSQYDFNYLDADKIQKILNEYSPVADWRVTRVGKKKIVFETLGMKNIKPAYKTWIYWRNNKSYKVYAGSCCCDFYKY